MVDRALQQQSDSIRLPVYDIEGFRTDWPVYDQMLINMFAEVVKNPVTGDGDVVATKRPGIAMVDTAVAGTPDIDFSSHFTDPGSVKPLANLAITNLFDVYVAAFEDSGMIRIIQYRPQAKTTTLLGSITSNVSYSQYDRVYLTQGWTGTEFAPTINILITWEAGDGSSSKAYRGEAAAGVFSTIAEINNASDPNSPWGMSKITRGPIIQLGQQFYVATKDGVIYNTGTVVANTARVRSTVLTAGAEEGWVNALNAISSMVPEEFQTLIQYKHHLVAVGRTTIQFYSNEGQQVNPGSPLLPTDQAFIKFGCISGKHIINVDDVLYWVAYGKENTVGIWRLDGYTPVKISTKKLDDIVRNMAQQTTSFKSGHMFTIVVGNKKHIGISDANTTNLQYASLMTESGTGATQPTSLFEGRGNIAMYSIEDRTWWYIYKGNCTRIFPATSFGNTIASTYNLGAYKQYILCGPGSSSVRAHVLYTVTEGVYLDDYNDGNTQNEFVPCSIQINGVQVATEKRKRINKVKLILGSSYPKYTSDTNVYTMWMHFSRNNIIDDVNDIQSRYIYVPNSFYRYYWNNLGMARNLSLCFSEKSKYPLSVKFIELDLTQGTA